MPTITTEQTVSYFEQRGEGPDIVWVSGGGGLPEPTWMRYQLPSFPGFRHTVFHNRGIGRTVCEQPGPWTIGDFARDTASLIEQRCDGRVVVIGKSMGGMIVTQLALDRPDLVRLAIPMGSAARSAGWVHEYMRTEIELRENGGSLSGMFAVCHYAGMLFPADELGDDGCWAAIKDMLSGFADEEGNENERSLVLQWDACDTFDVVEQLATCEVPLHVVGFGQDVQAPPNYGREVAELAPTGVFHLVEGAGHASLWGPKRAGEVNALVHEIIAGELGG